jgi:hypothetical protein
MARRKERVSRFAWSSIAYRESAPVSSLGRSMGLASWPEECSSSRETCC